MKRLVVVTDLDGTLLEPDGSLREEVRELLPKLRALDVPVYPVTSKTAVETSRLVRALGLRFPAGIENGAGIVDASGTVTLGEKAVPVASLRDVAKELRKRSKVAFQTLDELNDETLSGLLQLPPRQIALVRARSASLPLLSDPRLDEELALALPAQPKVRLLRGNRFLHLQGDHSKAEVLPLILSGFKRREVLLLGLGDSPNDLAMLKACDVAFIVSSAKGAHPLLQRHLPEAQVTSRPHGEGWAWAVEQVVNTYVR